MCLILDANKYSNFLNPNNEDMYPVKNWIENKNGKIVYARINKMEKELDSYPPMREQFNIYRDAGKLKIIALDEVEEAQNNLPQLKSDDPHIIALAKVAGVKLLVSGDKNLHQDFKKIVGGKIYQTEKNKHLLNKDTCP